jgi:Mg2+-importing ATPase
MESSKAARGPTEHEPAPPFWSVPADDLLEELGVTFSGLSSAQALERLASHGPNLLSPEKASGALGLFLNQFKSPIVLILIFASVLSFLLHDPTDALIIMGIVLLSGLLGFWQERGAANALARLLALVRTKAVALRDGASKEIPVHEIVPGDVVVLSAGAAIPGDCRILEAKDLFVDEATLTGESYPVEKTPGLNAPDTPVARVANCLFMGTHVVSGTATALVVKTGRDTEFGKISQRLRLRPPETEFQRGVRRFGYMLMEITLILIMGIFMINVFFARPVLEAFLFSLALAVGLTPQLLPAIISVNLAHGARRMAVRKVIVKRLNSIENFGSMNVLCSDKTGTLTEGLVHLQQALDLEGKESQRVLLHAYLNAHFETGFPNPIDEAIRNHHPLDVANYRKLDEVPYDFLRKRLSVLVETGGSSVMITKGTLPNVLAVCPWAELGKEVVDLGEVKEGIQKSHEELSEQGYRVLAVARKEMGAAQNISRDDEKDMVLMGLLVFFDPPREDVAETIRKLGSLGVSLKIITGDNQRVARNLALQVGLRDPQVITGPELRLMSDEALSHKVNQVTIFAEVEPNQKERIILALKKAGNVVGYMGDGINDASALHAADVGISVDGAVDVAKDAADLVLMERGLEVLAQGVEEGRRTFANTLKYVFMATSANFGNMFSMAGASLFLPFLPLLPKQILLTNLLTDFPEMTIAMDRVDPEMVDKPRRWDIRFIKRFMVTFGLVSSIFDYLTFGVLLFLLKATPEQFRTGWFLESVISACVIVLVVRTRKPFMKSAPGKPLLIATFLVVVATLWLPQSPFAKLFSFQPLPSIFLIFMGGIVLSYILAAEAAKRWFYKRSRATHRAAGS